MYFNNLWERKHGKMQNEIALRNIRSGRAVGKPKQYHIFMLVRSCRIICSYVQYPFLHLMLSPTLLLSDILVSAAASTAPPPPPVGWRSSFLLPMNPTHQELLTSYPNSCKSRGRVSCYYFNFDYKLVVLYCLGSTYSTGLLPLNQMWSYPFCDVGHRK